MKARRVFVTLEIETNLPLNVLRHRELWHFKGAGEESKCLQVQANVARGATPKKKRRGKK